MGFNPRPTGISETRQTDFCCHPLPRISGASTGSILKKQMTLGAFKWFMDQNSDINLCKPSGWHRTRAPTEGGNFCHLPAAVSRTIHGSDKRGKQLRTMTKAYKKYKGHFYIVSQLRSPKVIKLNFRSHNFPRESQISREKI